MRRTGPVVWISYAIVLIFLGTPIVATFLFSVATKWNNTILPEGYTLAWYVQMLRDSEVHAAIGRSFLLSGGTVVLSLLLVTPAAFVVYLYYPRLLSFLRIMALMPYALPGVILATGLIQLYSSGPLPIAGTPWILLLAYLVITLPYTYTSLINSLQSIDAKRLVEAAQMLGASRIRTFISVIVPNIRPGLISAALLSFSVALGEFVLANMLVGGRYRTLQLLLEKAMHSDGRLSSAMVVVYFILVAIASIIMMRIVNSATGAGGKGRGKAATTGLPAGR